MAVQELVTLPAPATDADPIWVRNDVAGGTKMIQNKSSRAVSVILGNYGGATPVADFGEGLVIGPKEWMPVPGMLDLDYVYLRGLPGQEVKCLVVNITADSPIGGGEMFV